MEPDELRAMVSRLAQVSHTLSTQDKRNAIKLSYAIREHLKGNLQELVTRFSEEPILLAVMSDGWGATTTDKVIYIYKIHISRCR